MCMLCAAIPAAAAAGAKINTNSARKQRQALELGLPVRANPIPWITAGVVGLLLAASILYHTLFYR